MVSIINLRTYYYFFQFRVNNIGSTPVRSKSVMTHVKWKNEKNVVFKTRKSSAKNKWRTTAKKSKSKRKQNKKIRKQNKIKTRLPPPGPPHDKNQSIIWTRLYSPFSLLLFVHQVLVWCQQIVLKIDPIFASSAEICRKWVAFVN